MCVLVCFCLDSICGGDSHKSSRIAMFPKTIIGSSCFGLIKQNTRFIFPTLHRSGIHNETTTASSQELSVSQPDTNAIVSQSNVLEPKIYQLQPDCLKDVNTHVTPVRQVWVENMSTPHSIKLGLMELHPSIFSAFPRPDVIQENHRWQTMYKHVDWTCMKTRAELSGTGAKPWPQKGLGRARHGSRRAPMWIKGGWAVGPRGPKTYFYMLPHHKRVAGLIATLSAKFSQNDIHVVDTFETFPLDGTTSHLEELCETRRWGPSVLFVDQMDLDEHPKCTKAEHFHRTTEPLNYVNVIPVYGLNVFSMLKHETLVLTTAAVNEIQNRLLFNLIRTDLRNVVKQYKPNPIYKM